LRLANTRAFNERYEDESVPDAILPQTSTQPYPTTYDLLKSLQSIEYNIDGEDVNGCAGKLHEVIHHVMYKIISGLPQYERSNAW
jgi:hypothetical protein